MNLLDRITLNLSQNRKKIVLNLYWALLGKIVNVLGGLIVGIFIARYLGPKQFGLMNYIISFVSIFTVISTFGLDNIDIRELSKNPDKRDIILGTSFRLRIILSLITIALIITALYVFKTDNYTSSLILIYSISIIFNTLNVIRNYFTSIVLNKYIVKTEILRTLIGALIKVVLLIINAPLEYFIIALAFDFGLVASGYLYSYKKKVSNLISWKYDIKVAKYMLRESYPLVLSGTAVIIYQRIDQVMINNMIDSKSVGYFSAALKFTELILFLPTIISQTLTPFLIRAKERNINDYYIKRLQFISIVVWSSIILSSIISLTASPLITLTFGEAYISAVPVLQIMAWKAVGMALSESSGQLIIIEGIQKYAFIRNLIGCLICIGLNYILIPQYGIIGSAIVTVITVCFTGLISHILIPKYNIIFRIQIESLFMGWKIFTKFLKNKKI